jgi:hypothetical protein
VDAIKYLGASVDVVYGSDALRKKTPKEKLIEKLESKSKNL